MPKPVCIKCHRFYRVKKTGFYFTEGMPVTGGILPGNDQPDGWLPYKIWSSDRWECLGCGSEILSGFGSSPIAVQHEEGFDRQRKDLRADQFQVNDC